MKTIVLFSGGLDSAVVLAQSIIEGDVIALTFDYEQSNHDEVLAARQLCELWGVPHVVQDIKLARTDARFEIPARNTIFLSYALELALLEGAGRVSYGAEPDATYCDSSLPYIKTMQNLFQLHGVTLATPVKDFVDKGHVLHEALELGVPLDLLHSSRTNNLTGCKTSARFLLALQEFFPYFNPLDLLGYLGKHATNPFDLRSPTRAESFKYWPALLTVARAHPSATYKVYTTGNWGRALWDVNLIRRLHTKPISLETEVTNDLEKLGKSDLSTGDTVGQWGIKQALSHLPRPRYLNAHLCVPVTQGHLKKAVLSLGYKIGSLGICLITGSSD